jgi:hypothetical protein
MTLQKPSQFVPFGNDATIRVRVYCVKYTHTSMMCDRDCEKCEWKNQKTLEV